MVAQALVPVLARYESEAHDALTTIVSVWHYDRVAGVRLSASAAGVLDDVDPAAVRGETRLWFRRTIKPYRSLYDLQAIYGGIRPETGFSGFHLTGSVKVTDDVIDVYVRGFAVTYNRWQWVNPM